MISDVGGVIVMCDEEGGDGWNVIVVSITIAAIVISTMRGMSFHTLHPELPSFVNDLIWFHCYIFV